LDRGLVPERWDVFKVKRKVDVFPVDPVKQTLKKEKEQEEAESDAECDENRYGVALQPVM